jgi:hypothetical protein
MGIHGVLVCLPAKFVSGKMIPFAVGCCGGGVGVCRKIVQFCSSLVCTLWHDAALLKVGRFYVRARSVSPSIVVDVHFLSTAADTRMSQS